MKKVFILLIAGFVLVFAEYAIFCNFSSAETTAADVMKSVWQDIYPDGLRNEVVFSQEFGGEERDVGMWIDHTSRSALIFIGNYETSRKRFDRRSGGTLYLEDDNPFDYRVYVVREVGRRARVKEKAVGTLQAKANGTQLNYFDIVRAVEPENPDDFEFSFIEKEDSAWQIKATPKYQISGDYDHRIFSIYETEDSKRVIGSVGYFQAGSQVKTKLNSGFSQCKSNGSHFWRPDKIIVSTEEGATELAVIKRSFNVNFGELSEKDLKRGTPGSW
jgi:hypothetical protein